MQKPNKSCLVKGIDAISEKKNKEGNTSDFESDNPSSNEDDVNYSFTEDDTKHSDDVVELDNVYGVNEENMK